MSVYSKDQLKSYGETVVSKSIWTNKPFTRHKRFYIRYREGLSDWGFFDDYRELHDLQETRYLVVRAGHTTDTVIPLPQFLNIKAHKKERKITIYGYNKTEVRTLAKIVHNLRASSPYTGRGIKIKHVKIKYKKVRKTKAGGRAF